MCITADLSQLQSQSFALEGGRDIQRQGDAGVGSVARETMLPYTGKGTWWCYP